MIVLSLSTWCLTWTLLKYSYEACILNFLLSSSLAWLCSLLDSARAPRKVVVIQVFGLTRLLTELKKQRWGAHSLPCRVKSLNSILILNVIIQNIVHSIFRLTVTWKHTMKLLHLLPTKKQRNTVQSQL